MSHEVPINVVTFSTPTTSAAPGTGPNLGNAAPEPFSVTSTVQTMGTSIPFDPTLLMDKVARMADKMEETAVNLQAMTRENYHIKNDASLAKA